MMEFFCLMVLMGWGGWLLLCFFVGEKYLFVFGV